MRSFTAVIRMYIDNQQCFSNLIFESCQFFQTTFYKVELFLLRGGLKHRKRPDVVVVCDDLLVKLAWNEATLPLLLYTQPPNLRLLHAWQITSNCAFFVLPPSQSIIIALNVFSPKKHYLLAKNYRVLLWDSFVCACHKIGNQILVFKVTKIGIALQFKYFPPLKNPSFSHHNNFRELS